MIRFNLVKKRFETYKLKLVLSSEYILFFIPAFRCPLAAVFRDVDVGTYRQVRPLSGYLHLPIQSTAARIRTSSPSFAFFGYLSIWKPSFPS